MIKYLRYTLLIFVLILTSCYAQKTSDRLASSNLERFTIFGIMKVHPSRDSINATIFINIPNYAVQFVKSDTGYVSRYDLQLSVLNEDDDQVYQYLWTETVHTNQYIKTMSLEESNLFFKQIRMKKAPFSIRVDILDRDTRKRAEKELQFKPELHVSGDLAVFPSIVMHKTMGNWGFGDGFLPVLNNMVSYRSDSLAIFVTGWADDGDAVIEIKNKTNDHIKWNLKDTIRVSDGYFVYKVKIPVTSLKSIKNLIQTTVSQGKQKVTDTQEITMRKQGLSMYVRDINVALEQMRYILTEKERSQVNKASRKDKEELFNTLWDKRDPSPGTPLNELMEEYYRRVAFANEYFSSFQNGWETDMGMIYILLGPPEDRERESLRGSRVVEETWYYFRINRSFTFRDSDGFGEYSLITPFVY